MRSSSSILVLFTILLTVLLTACGGGDSDGDSNGETDVGIGWVTISSEATFVSYNDDGAYALISGTAFISKSYIMLPCAGICCFLCWFDNGYPGVDVELTNNTNYWSGFADNRYGTLTDWYHLWSATVPLSVGSNDITVTAFDPAGNIGHDSVTINYFPPAPNRVWTDSDDRQIALEWKSVWGADSYHIYWSTQPSVTKYNSSIITNVNSPFTHSNLVNGLTYYYVITSVFADYESSVSAEVSVIAGLPPRPTEITATVEDAEIVISWDDIPTATSYNLYWSNNPNVTVFTGSQIADIVNPFIHTNLVGMPYYYIITGVNNWGEGNPSLEVTAMPQLPPPAPTNLTATPYSGIYIKVEWNPVPGASNYKLERCAVFTITSEPPEAGLCDSSWPFQFYWEEVYSGSDVSFQDRDATLGQAYRYRVTAENPFGEGETSEEIGIVYR